MNKISFCFLFFCVLCFSCKKKDNLEDALRFAGDNRPELEKVLAHYGQRQSDSLKYKAAVFLIENMPAHYFFMGNELDAFRDTILLFGVRNDYPVNALPVRNSPVGFFEDRYTIPAFRRVQKVYDSHVITAEYLIENIDLAFEAWERTPWGKSITFADFCEQILPYRSGNEPLENWRRKYKETFQPILDQSKSNDPFEAAQLLYDTMYNRRWIFDSQMPSGCLGAVSLLICRVGSCRMLADYAVFVFRSVGIPCGIDCILQTPDMLYRAHYWNYLKDASGRTFFLEMYQPAPSPEPGYIKRKKGKVYRIHYGRQASSIALRYEKGKIPDLLNNACLTDVSSEYFDGVTVEYKAGGTKITGSLLYIGVFDNKTWIPVTCSKIKEGKIIFRDLEPGIVYQALYYLDEELVPFSVPFIALANGHPYFLHPDAGTLQTMCINRKFPLPVWMDEFRYRSVGGLFQGANRSDFSDAVTLFTTTEELDLYYHRTQIDNSEKFGYLRYYSAPDSHCNMAELCFFNGDNELTGKVIGSEGVTYSFENSKYAVFDKDPVTFFDAVLADSTWVGLELDEPATVTEIEYLYRNDDNSIREGDVYELFYFTSEGLISLGKRIGIKNGVLTYENVPSNALYLLHNATRGREERPFTYENGQQVWW